MHAPSPSTSARYLAEPLLVSRELWQTEIARRHLGSAALRSAGVEAPNIKEPLSIANLRARELYRVLRSMFDMKSTDYDEALKSHFLDVEARARRDGFSEEEIARIVTDAPMVEDFIARRADSRNVIEAHRKFMADWPGHKESIARCVRNGIEKGYIPECVEDRLTAALDNTSIRIVDSLVLGSSEGCYNRALDLVYLAHNCGHWEASRVLLHEFFHQTSGASPLLSGDSAPFSQRTRAGFASYIRPGLWQGNGLNEAVTEHLTLSAFDGDFEEMDPLARRYGSGAYKGYRKIVATFINRSGGLIDMKTVINAYFEDDGPSGGTTARQTFARACNKAYGEGALDDLERLIKKFEETKGRMPSRELLSRIRPPVLDKRGYVEAIGAIDLFASKEFLECEHRVRERAA